jgi:nitrogen fixation NifU-like protein
MNDELRNLYQEVVVDHSRRPRNFRKVEGATRTVEGFNPLCGDHLTLYVKLEDNRIEDIGFQGSGCAISKASASLMTAALKGKPQEEALILFDRVHTLLTEGPNGPVAPDTLGKLSVLSGVWEFPMRVKCATLAWHALRNALEGRGLASTE